MKLLYININDESIQSNDNIEVIGSAEDSIVDGFYITLGMAIADGMTGIKYKPLVADFAKAKPDEFKSFIKQWNEVKALLFGENPSGDIEFVLPSKYLEWLKMNGSYSDIYYKKYQGQREAKVSLSLDELYEDTIDVVRRKVIHFLGSNDNYKNFGEFVVNDDAVTRCSLFVRSIQNVFKNISFVTYGEIEPPQPIVQHVYVERVNLPDSTDIIDVSKFEEGYAIVNYRGNNWSYIDTSGRLLFTPRSFKQVMSFHDNNAYVLINNMEGAVINLKGEIVKKLPNGHRLFSCSRRFSDGLCAFRGFDKWGYIDREGELVIPYAYDEAFDFEGGIAKVHFPNDSKDQFKYINKSGEVIPVEKIESPDCKLHNKKKERYDIENALKLSLVGKNVFGVKDDMNNWIIPCVYKSIKYIGEYYLLAQKKKVTDLYKLYNAKTKYVQLRKQQYSNHLNSQNEQICFSNLMIFSVNNRVFRFYSFGDKIREINDIRGVEQLVGQMNMKMELSENDSKEDNIKLSIIKKTGLYGFINAEGETVIRCVYDNAKTFYEGIAAVKIGNHWGFINTSGEIIIDFVFSDVENFRNGICLVRYDCELNLIDKKGHLLIKY